jgi:hypothetical protein
MNETVGRSRGYAWHPALSESQSGKTTEKFGKLEGGKPIKWSGVSSNIKLKLKQPSLEGGEKAPKLSTKGKMIARSERQPSPLSNRQMRGIEGSKAVRDYNNMMRTINNDPGLKEVHSHIMNVQSCVVEMMGLDPATHEELEHLTSSLTLLKDKLGDAENILGSRPLDLREDQVKNPAPAQRGAIQFLKGAIDQRLNELHDLKLPPPPYSGPSTSDVLHMLEPKLPRLIPLANTPSLREGLENIVEGVSIVKTGLAQLDRAPGNRLDMGNMAEELAEIIERLSEFANTKLDDIAKNPAFANVSGDLKNLIAAAKQQLQSHIDSLDRATGLNPLSTKAIFHSKTFSTIGAQNLLKERLGEAKENLAQLQQQNAPKEKLALAQEAVKVLTNAVKFLDDRLVQLRTGNSDDRISGHTAKRLMGSGGADKGIGGNDSLLSRDGKYTAETFAKVMQENIDLTSDGPLLSLAKSHPNLREDGIMELFVDFALRHAMMDVPKDLRTELQERRFEALNNSEWKPISKEVIMRHGGESHAMTSDVIPQSNLGEHFSDMKGGGVVCHASRHFEHGTTVAVSRLTAPDGTKLFEGVRHGILNTYGISSRTLHKLNPGELTKLVENLLTPSKELWKKNHLGEPSLDLTIARIKTDKSYRRMCSRIMQENGSERRALDLVTTNLLKNDEKLKLALGDDKNKPQTVEINLNSIALVTPDHVRGIKGRSGPGNERKMLEGQIKALQKVAGRKQPFDLVIKNANGEEQTVSVRVNVNAFNFGVNGGGFKFGGKLGVISGWGTSDSYNKKAMDALIGSKSDRKNERVGGQVKAFLEKTMGKLTVEQDRIITDLAMQVAKMWDDKSYHSAGNEPYKMVSRLALLSSMIGGDTCWNCKSGKDRTGQMDVETKRLAAEIWMRKEVPKPDVEPDDVTKSNRFRMAMDGGNLEIQNFNTGAPGFKLGGVDALKDQMKLHEDDMRYEYFRGIAGFYGT